MTESFNNTLYGVLAKNASLYSNKIVLLDGKIKITFAKLKKYVDSIATYLADYGIKEGDRIGVFMNNCWEYVATIFAISKVGAIIVPINTFLKSSELSYILKDANINLIFAEDQLRSIINGSVAVINCGQVVWVGDNVRGTRFSNLLSLKNRATEAKREADDIAAIFYTSGTTGKPKGALLSNKNILSNAPFIKKHLKLTKKDRVLLFIPIFHSYAFHTGLITPIANALSVIIIRSIKPFDNIIKQTLLKRATIFLGVPEIFNSIVYTKLSWSFKAFNNIRVVVSGGSSLNKDVQIKLQSKFKKAKIIEGYGLTETAAFISSNPVDAPKIGSVGIVSDICEIKIVDANDKTLQNNQIGEIIVRGDNVIKSYLNCNCNNIKDGWLYTEDLGYLDNDNYLFLVGRKSDIIISKGFNIYPKEIENILDRYPGIKKSAVIGVFEDKINGEIPIAFLEVEDMQIDETKLKKYANGFLASYKVPKKYIIIDSIPTTSTGKVIKTELKTFYDDIKD